MRDGLLKLAVQVRGPSGTGVSDLYTPEINSVDSSRVIDIIGYGAHSYLVAAPTATTFAHVGFV